MYFNGNLNVSNIVYTYIYKDLNGFGAAFELEYTYYSNATSSHSQRQHPQPLPDEALRASSFSG